MPSAPMNAAWRNRIIRYADEPPESLLAHPQNPKIHPKFQQDALSGALSDLGWLAPCVVNERTQHVLDGHLRIGLAISRNEPTIPVVYVDLDEAQEAEALLTFDPIGNLAVVDKANLDALMHEVTSGDAAVQAMLADLAKDAGLLNGVTSLSGVQSVPEQFMVIVDCHTEGRQVELLEMLGAQGWQCKALVS